MSKFWLLFGALLVFALLNTFLLVLALLGITPWSPAPIQGPHTPPQASISILMGFLQLHSFISAPVSCAALLGAWIWRGRTKSEWVKLGLDKDVFRLLLQMKGSKARSMILTALRTPKDRFQLAKVLSLDWSTIDYHIRVLCKHGLIGEKNAYGNVKLYELTPSGVSLLKVLEELNREGVQRENTYSRP